MEKMYLTHGKQAIAAAALLMVTGFGARAGTLQNQFFDWTIGDTPAPPNFVSSPFLTDANRDSVNTFLSSLPADSIHAIKVEHPISDSTANLIFSNPSYNVAFVFADLETANPVPDVQRLVSQLKTSNSASAAVGNFGMSSIAGDDPTQPGNYRKDGRGHHSFSGFRRDEFLNAGVNMSNADLYPGDPSYRNPISANSSAPNIRSALFTLPAWRVSQVTATKTTGELNIPYVADFNNYFVDAFDSDHDPSTGYRFDNPTHDQMLSSQDTAALLAHYRLRGADSVHLMTTGVVTKTQEEFQNEVRTGWTETHIAERMTAPDRMLLVKDGPNGKGVPGLGDNSSIVIDGSTKTIEEAGALWSGVYSLSQEKMDVLLSNMDGDSHTITLPSKMGGFSVATTDFTVPGGSHLLVEYGLSGSGKNRGWNSVMTLIPFTELDGDRGHPGVPEPTIVAMLGIGGMMVITRRRRRSAD
jgi:hypothetical protein